MNRCPHCQAPLQPDSVFCGKCGRVVATTAIEDAERTVVHAKSSPTSAGGAGGADESELNAAREASATNSAATLLMDSQPSAATVPPDPLIGRTLDNRYQLVGQLGRGGMGTVYRARRLALGDEVAVKVLHKEYVEQPEMLERFRREAKAAARLHHPNVVIIYDFGDRRDEAEGAAPAYIVMELLHGESLRDVLQREGALSVKRAVHLLRETCAGVGAAHRQGIIHRDIKPDNIIVLMRDEHGDFKPHNSFDSGNPGSHDNPYETRPNDYYPLPTSNFQDSESDETEWRETVKVVDFGIAKLRDMTQAATTATITQVGAMLGTPSYMSPEQCRGEHLDARADVYSLGAIAYELLSGRPPFTAPTVTGVVAKHLTEPPPPLAPPDININSIDNQNQDYAELRRIEAVIHRALAKNPHARQEDALSFGRELQAALRGIEPPTSPLVVPPTDSSSSSTSTLDAPNVASNSNVTNPANDDFTTQISAANTGNVYVDAAPTTQSRQHQQSRVQHEQQMVIPLTQTQTLEPYIEGTSANNATGVRRRFPLGFMLILGLVAVLAAGIAGAGAWMLFGDKDIKQTNVNKPPTQNNSNQIARTANENANNSNLNATNANVNASPINSPQTTPTPLPSVGVAVNQASNANASPAPVTPATLAVAKKEVQDTVEGWVKASRERNLEQHMSYYAEQLDNYYRRQLTSRELVRRGRRRAFIEFSKLDINIKNVRVTVDPTGSTATVVFDKSWKFDGERTSRGSVQQALSLRKVNNRWLITGERDLRIDFVENGDNGDSGENGDGAQDETR